MAVIFHAFADATPDEAAAIAAAVALYLGDEDASAKVEAAQADQLWSMAGRLESQGLLLNSDPATREWRL